MDHAQRKPTVSIVMPFLNSERFIQETVESVLRQEFHDWEMWLVDDGSADASTVHARAYVEQYPGKIFYLEHPGHTNRGISASRNFGITRARGRYIASLDSDDVWLPSKLERQVAILDSQPNASMVYGLSQYWYSWSGRTQDRERDYVPDLGIPGDRLYPPRSLTPLLYPLGTGTPAPPSDWLVRREAVALVQGFEEQFHGPYGMYEDHAFLAKMYLHGSVFVSSEVWERYRIHADSYMARVKQAGEYRKVRDFFLDWFREYLRREGIEDAEVWSALEEAIHSEPSQEEVSRMGKWMLRCAGGSAAELIFSDEDPGAVRIEIQNAASKVKFDVQLNLPRLETMTGHDYVVRFRARADSRRTLFFGFAEAHSPWANLGLYREIELTPEWQDFEGAFTAAVDETNGRIHFDAGESDISLELASVQLLRAPDGEAVEPGELSSVRGRAPSNSAEQVEPAPTPPVPRPGQVQFGSFRRLAPISTDWGWDRGQPVDRYYVGEFLTRHASHIRGRVLEIGDNAYTREFGGKHVTTSDVLHVDEGAPGATFIGDLSHAPHIPSDLFDCIILTQTLQLIYDVKGAIRTLHRILKPGGVLLATMPGISQIYDHEWSKVWFWTFTQLSMRRLLEDEFSVGNVEIETFGNVLAATSFLQGLSAEELTLAELNYSDPGYTVTIGAKATKPAREDRNRALILMYHRVVKSPNDPWGLNVSPENFAQQMEVIRRHAHPTRLRDLPVTLAAGSTDRPVVITFDDGYADNLNPAAHLLQQYGVPATVFLVARAPDADPEFWWDELERILLNPGALPTRLHLSIEGADFEWDLGATAQYTAEESAKHSTWRAWTDAPTPRHAIYVSLWQRLRPMPEEHRRGVMRELRAWAGVSATSVTHPLLTSGGVSALAAIDLIEIGAHTVSHPMLSAQSAEVQRAEIRNGKEHLERALGRPVVSFAYPYGEYTAATVNIVREAGFSFACTTKSALVDSSADHLQLARVMAEDWDGEEFERQLDTWFGTKPSVDRMSS